MRRLLLIIALAGCGSSSKDPGKGALGKATGEAVAAAVLAAAATVEPWRCARLDEPIAVIAPAGWELDGRRLRRTDGDGARIAVIGEARGGSTAVIEALRSGLDAEPVDLVLSLGGLGATESEIAVALAPLARDAPWLVVAVPGDREAIAAHRAAVAALAAGGAAIVDGSQIRLIELGGAVIGTLPGVPDRARLGAGTAGCVHDEADVAALLAAVIAAAPAGKVPHLTVLASQRAPRGGDDLAPGGVHAGDLDLAAALVAHPVDLVLHGAVDDASAPAGKQKRGAGPRRLAVGALDATTRYRDDGAPVVPSALVVSVGEREVTWRPLVPRVVP